jgi:hypothetical protein
MITFPLLFYYIFTEIYNLMMFYRWILLLAVIFLTTFQVHAQRRMSKNYPAIGLEIDVLPYLSGGYYGSIWYGYGQVRGRAIMANTNAPQFFIPTGFKDNNLMIYSIIGDYFIQSTDFKGLWIAAGAEYWDASIVSETSEEQAEYVNYVITLGLGYIWKFYQNFYLNPWFGLHIIAAGDTSVPVGNEQFKPPTITPEISLKLGWHWSFKSKNRSYLRSKTKKRRRR